MKLDRNVSGTGRGKYGLIKTRRLHQFLDTATATIANQQAGHEVQAAIELLEKCGILDWGPSGTESEFFVIKLRDMHAGVALHGYAGSAIRFGDDLEYAQDVQWLALRAGTASPFCKKPD